MRFTKSCVIRVTPELDGCIESGPCTANYAGSKKEFSSVPENSQYVIKYWVEAPDLGNIKSPGKEVTYDYRDISISG